MRSVAREKLNRILLHSMTILNFKINFGGAGFCKIVMLTTVEATLEKNLYVNMERNLQLILQRKHDESSLQRSRRSTW
jgi:hypothetical protein